MSDTLHTCPQGRPCLVCLGESLRHSWQQMLLAPQPSGFDPAAGPDRSTAQLVYPDGTVEPLPVSSVRLTHADGTSSPWTHVHLPAWTPPPPIPQTVLGQPVAQLTTGPRPPIFCPLCGIDIRTNPAPTVTGTANPFYQGGGRLEISCDCGAVFEVPAAWFDL